MPKRASNRTTGIAIGAIVAGMAGLSFAAIPLYRVFCQATGFAGTPIVGASAAPFFAQKLVAMGGLSYVGGYVSGAAVISLIAVLCLKETRNNDLNQIA